MVAENSGIKNKAKLMAYLYKNPTKLAIKLSKFIKSSDGPLELVKLKGEGQGYYYSIQDKKLIRTCRDAEFYILPWADEDESKCYIYTHYNWMVGCIFKVNKEEIEYLGYSNARNGQ